MWNVFYQENNANEYTDLFTWNTNDLKNIPVNLYEQKIIHFLYTEFIHICPFRLRIPVHGLLVFISWGRKS
jgi:hypothetical protein